MGKGPGMGLWGTVRWITSPGSMETATMRKDLQSKPANQRPACIHLIDVDLYHNQSFCLTRTPLALGSQNIWSCQANIHTLSDQAKSLAHAPRVPGEHDLGSVWKKWHTSSSLTAVTSSKENINKSLRETWDIKSEKWSGWKVSSWCDALPPFFWFILLIYKQYYSGMKYISIFCDFCMNIMCPLHLVLLDFGKSSAYVFVCIWVHICGTVQSLCPPCGRSKFSLNTGVQRFPTLCQRTGDNVYVCLCGTINIQVYLPGSSAKRHVPTSAIRARSVGKQGSNTSQLGDLYVFV